MSYQVLARKYRPATFEEMEGQEHVLRALINALEQNRLHHAYLFTGTRGVGKTTIARILAKSLNCEKGVSASPCGECSACTEIAEGRSVDLIEVDAASRTRVEDTRELLDNVQYMPTRGRFKVYLIDEVHMLSNHSFNALLKTLEEPPEHVKFLLATTDPKKLPVTVLSRCLQFNLKNLSPERIVGYLKKVLDREQVSYEEPALWQLGRAADGSMRDALSLADQAVSFGHNSVTEADVKAMLGSIDQQEVYRLLDALVNHDAAALLDKIEALSEFAPDYESLLAELLSVLHRVAIAQMVPEGIDNSQGDRELVLAVAGNLRPEDVQLYYQIGLIGQRDLPYAPDRRSGFEMIMMRMMAFTPLDLEGGETTTQGAVTAGGEPAPSTRRGGETRSPIEDILAQINDPPAAGQSGSSGDSRSRHQAQAETAAPPPAPPPGGERDATPTVKASGRLDPADWVQVLPELGLSGVTHTLAANCVIAEATDDRCVLLLDESHASLWNKTHEGRISRALTAYVGGDVPVSIKIGDVDRETPAQAEERCNSERRQMAVDVIENDEKVQTLIRDFNGKLDTQSITPGSRAGD